MSLTEGTIYDPNTTLSDFDVGHMLGKGAFGRVRLATHKASGNKFAMKTLSKRMLVLAKQVGGALTEKEVLKQRGHPFIVRLYFAFQDKEHLHMVLDYCPGGDLYDRIDEEKTLPLERVRLYCAEISLGLGHLHDKLSVIYRDLKPENVLLDQVGHAKLTDFGLALRHGSRKTFAGSTEYLAPEVAKLKHERDGEHDEAVDWWGVGILIHELLVGTTPFGTATMRQDLVLKNILEAEIKAPDGVDEAAAAFILKLLVRDPAARLGSGESGTADVQADPFFLPLTFDGVRKRQYAPLYVPPEPKPPPEKKKVAPPPQQASMTSIAEDEPADDADDDAEADDDLSGSDDLEGSDEDDEDDEEDDEWHTHAPVGDDPDDDLDQEIFRGFTFRRERSFVSSSSFSLGGLTAGSFASPKKR